MIAAEPGRRLDADAQVEGTAATAARDGEAVETATVRLADAQPAAQAARQGRAWKPAMPLAARKRPPVGAWPAADVGSTMATADGSNRDRRDPVEGSSGPTTASGVAGPPAALVFAESVVPAESAVAAKGAVAAKSAVAAESTVVTERAVTTESASATTRASDPAALAAAPALASATWPEPESIPLYRTRVPPAATLRFALRVGAADGTAELRWRPEAETYGLRFDGRVESGPTLTQASDGGFDGAGLAPIRHTDARTRRGMLATNFQREAGQISFSGSRAQVALARGSQDRLSWMVQLAAVLAAEPALRLPGAVVSIPVAGLRGEAAVWRFRTVEPEAPAEAQAMQPRVRLVRDRQGPYDVDIAVALDPARHFLPATLSLRTANGLPALELVLREAAFEP